MILQKGFRIGTRRRTVSICLSHQARLTRRSLSNKSDEATTKSKSKISWYRGYLGANSNTEPPDAKFLAGN